MRSRWIAAVEVFSVSAFAALVVPLANRTIDAIESFSEVLTALLAAPLGYLAADLASGVVHWFCDTFFEEDTPVIGPLLIHPFREHHRDPLAMTHHGPLELTGNSCLALLPVPAIALLYPLPLALDSFLVFLALSMLATNVFHKWAHTENLPRWITVLQRCWLILPPQHHALHHRGAHTEAYCVTNGWANRLAESVRLFRWLERALIACGVPFRKTA